MITLHHLQIGRSLFTVWLLEELEANYQLKVYLRDPQTMRAPPELQKIHPLGKSPVIEDGNLVISESGAITSYLLERFDIEGRFAPATSELRQWARYTQWLHYPEGSVFTPLLVKMLLMRSKQEHTVLGSYSDREIPLHLGHIAHQLGHNSYILGDQITGADFGVCYVVALASRLKQLNDYPTLQSYLERCMARPAMQRAKVKAIE